MEGDRVRHSKFGNGTIKHLHHLKSEVHPADEF